MLSKLKTFLCFNKIDVVGDGVDFGRVELKEVFCDRILFDDGENGDEVIDGVKVVIVKGGDNEVGMDEEVKVVNEDEVIDGVKVVYVKDGDNGDMEDIENVKDGNEEDDGMIDDNSDNEDIKYDNSDNKKDGNRKIN
ncbi:hypothetical protein NAPIS_ORF02762 [Vairimorpha apis BRL 01]|uniref:Uncharacterized protein n=1 Tax=Vairimorpha apis BRL 01 TaxID=1037528 RepID=T0M8F7_9MICR|nr:hypothetical protein NAPIS_ORF02762 [Vairimorpha apis BRL 01]